MFGKIVFLLLGFPLVLLLFHTIVRIVRHFYKFPMPEAFAPFIDNPLRHKMQPPDDMPRRHGVEAGLTVLEVGPGQGTYTLATARCLGPQGRIFSIDIEPKIVARLRYHAHQEGIANLEAQVADAHNLPFKASAFDLVYMITVIGEIPAPEKAFREFHRVLSPDGVLAFSELVTDPDFPRAKTLIYQGEQAGFELRNRFGNRLNYSLRFAKVDTG